MAWRILSALLVVSCCTDLEVAKSINQDIHLDMMKWALGMLAITIEYVFEDLKLQKPNWWYHNGVLKRITNVLLNFFRANSTSKKTIYQASFIRACALFGLISKGEYWIYWAHCDEFINSLSVECTATEMKEANTLFKVVISEKSEDYAEDAYTRDAQLAAKITTIVEEARNSGALHSVIPERGTGISEAGLWVVIQDLVSPSGLAMNNKIVLVCMDGLEDGRVAVKVDGIISPKRIKPRNLRLYPMPENVVALISSMEEVDQWKYVRVMIDLNKTNLTFKNIGNRRST
ncbi:expressed unknown protein [Seminavis robusta]|uniref:Uncharacterized protein n=1 Tax=Seminavis robusta TaxID=568900 RepID=A0A9N8HQC6_9STRA|nr:expressed unknown protein [Seminavis robusta]|eukprot:Sro1152_g246940.1 n/a (289) ;mRNA; r:26706-27572